MRRLPSPFLGEPHWQPAQRLRRGALPAALRPWLLQGGSLTRHLQAACAADFGVELLHEGAARPARNEARALKLPGRRLAQVREVYLCCGDTPWVFARTVIPFATLRGPGRRLARLGARPLGAVLFATPGAHRGPLEIARVPPAPQRLRGAAPLPATVPLWGRRSCFFLADNAPLLVCELFLPGPERPWATTR